MWPFFPRSHIDCVLFSYIFARKISPLIDARTCLAANVTSLLSVKCDMYLDPHDLYYCPLIATTWIAVPKDVEMRRGCFGC